MRKWIMFGCLNSVCIFIVQQWFLLQMALWRVLDYTSAPLRVAVKHPPNNSLKLGKSSTLKLSETGRSPLNRLANRPVILRSSAYFEFHSFYIFRVFSLRFVSGGVFHAPSFFYAPKLLFQSFSSRTLLPENVKKTIQDLFQPIHAFL